MMCAGLIVGMPVFFEVGFVLLIPIAFTVARRTANFSDPGRPAAGGGAFRGACADSAASRSDAGGHHLPRRRGTHDLVRPVGGDSLRGVAGPIYGPFIAPRIVLDAHNPMAEQFAEHDANRVIARPSASRWPLFLLPVVLMLVGSWAGVLAAPGTATQPRAALAGDCRHRVAGSGPDQLSHPGQNARL